MQCLCRDHVFKAWSLALPQCTSAPSRANLKRKLHPTIAGEGKKIRGASAVLASILVRLHSHVHYNVCFQEYIA